MQKLIYAKVVEFCIRNIGVQQNYTINIVCAGGMGSSTFFNEGMTAHIE